MTFSQSEKEAALLEFARSDPLSGGSTARSLELTRAVLVQEPDAIFTILRLTTAKLLTTIEVMLDLLDELTDTATDLAAKPQELNDISSLLTSASLARSVDSSISSRGVVGRGQGTRLSTSLRKSALDLTEGLRSNTRLSSSYDEARGTASGHIRTLRSQLTALLDTASNVSNAVATLNGSSVRSRLAEDRVHRIRLGVEDLADQMESLEPVDRSVLAKPSSLRLLAADVELQDVLRELSSGEPRLVQPVASPATYKLDAAGSGDAPSVQGTVSAPWPIEVGSEDLTINVNGASTGPIDLLDGTAGILAAELIGSVHEDDSVPGSTGFPIMTDITTPPTIESAGGPFVITLNVDDQLYIKVDSTTFVVTLTAGTPRTATQIATDITTAIGGDPVTATAVSGRVQLSYTNSSPPASFSARRLEVITSQGGYNPKDDATPLGNGVTTFWRLASGPLTLGTRSVGWLANHLLRLQVNDDPNVVQVSLPTGLWPDYLVQLGDDVTPGTIVYTIDQALSAASENATAEDDSGYLRIYSTDEGEGSIITIRSNGTDSDSGRGATTLGFGRDQEDRKSDVEATIVVAALKKNATLIAGATPTNERTDYFEGSGEITVDDEIEVEVAEDPTGGWPSASRLKMTVNAPNAYGTYQVSGYSWSAGTLTLETSRRLRDPLTTTCWVNVYSSFLKIESNDATTSGLLQMSGTPTTTLGLSTSLVRAVVRQFLVSENDPIIGWVTKNLLGDNIRARDIIRTASGSGIDLITAVDEENGLLDLLTGVPGNYTVSTTGFTIFSASALSYATLVDGIEVWTATEPSELLNDVAGAFARLYVAKSRDAASNARTRITIFKTSIESIQAYLASYSPQELSVVINALNSLTENGQDRARALLIDDDIEGFVDIVGDGSTIEALREAASAVSYRDLGAQRDNRQSRLKAVWVDAVDPRNVYPDFEVEEDAVYGQTDWGDRDI